MICKYYGCKTSLSVRITDLEAWCNISFAGATSNPLNCQGELFLNGTLVTDVEVPEGIGAIKDYAFYKYKFLSSIKIPSTVTSIGYSAFYESTLSSVTFAPGSQLATIGASAFEKTSLGTICIPSTVTSIGAKAFQTNYAWTTVFCCAPNVPSTSTSTFNESWNKPMNCPLIYPYGSDYSSWITTFGFKSATEFTINGIVYQGIEISSSKKAVAKYVTSDAIADGAVTIPASVTYSGTSYDVAYIMEGAFKDCGSVTKVYFERVSPAELIIDAFAGLSNSCEMNVPGSNLAAYETAWGRDLNAYFPIGSMFTYPVDVTSNGTTTQVNMKFKVTGNDGDITVQVGAGQENAAAIASETAGDLVIPSSFSYQGYNFAVKAIGAYAFYNCAALTSITIPTSIKNIYNYTTSGCSSLERVIMESPTPPSKGDYSIGGTKRECLLIVPEGSRQAYSSWAVNFLNVKEVGKENVIEIGDVAIHPLTAISVNTGDAIENCYYAYVTYIDLTPGQRKAIIYHPLSLYAPTEDFDQNPCWDDQYKYTNVAIFNAVTSNYTACSLSIPSSVTDSEGNEYTVVGIGANAAYSGYFSGVREIRIPKTITHIGRYAFKGLGSLTGKVVFPSSVRQIGSPSKTSFANVFSNYCSGSNYIGWVKEFYIMHINAADFHWYDAAYTGVISNGAGYFYYNNNTSNKSYLYISQDVKNTYESTQGNGVYAWRQGNAYKHHYCYSFDPALVAGISGDKEHYEAGTYELYVQNRLDLPLTVDNFTSSNEDVVNVLSYENGYLEYEVLSQGSATISFSYPGDDVLDPLSSSVTITYPDDIFIATVDDYNVLFKILTEDEQGGTVQFGAVAYDNTTLDFDDAPSVFSGKDEIDQFTVPQTVEHDGKTYTVTAIGAYAFAYFYGESLVLPPTINTIGYRAFNCEYYNPTVKNLYVNSQEPPTCIISDNYSNPFNSQFSEYCKLHVPEGCKAAYNDWADYFKKILEPVDAIVINGIAYTGDNTDLFGDGTASLTWEYEEESYGGGGEVSKALRRLGEKGGENGSLVPVLTLDNATINYNGNGPAIEVNSYPRFYIRLRGENTITAANANAAISVGTAKGEDFDEVSLIILNDDDEESGYLEPTKVPRRRTNGDGSDELASLTVANNKTGGDGIYVYSGSFNVQNCTVDATGSSYGLRFFFEDQGYSPKAPRRQTKEKRGSRKIPTPYGPVDPEEYSSFLNVYAGSELTLHGDEAALWGANNHYFQNVGVVESDLNAYKTQYAFCEGPEFTRVSFGDYSYYGSYEMWVSNDDDNWEQKYAKLLQIAPNVIYGTTNEDVEMMFTIVSKSEKTVRVGDDNWSCAIDDSYSGPITIPATVNGYDVVGIGRDAFYGCGITSVTLPETEKFSWIDPYAFEGSALQTVTIPDNVIRLGWDAFVSCNSLTSATIGEGITMLQGSTFSNCQNLETLILPNGLKSISNGDFYNCYNLPSIIIPNSVNNIGEQAFYGCSSLTEVTCNAVTPPSLDYYSFYNIGNNAVLKVPYGCYNKYNSDELYWKNSFTIQMIDDKTADIVTIEPEDEYVVVFGVDMTMTDDDGTTTALDLENAVAGGVYYNLVSNDDETNGVDTEEGCIVINTTTSEEDMADIVDSELRSEVMQEKFRGLIVEVNGKGTVKIDCMTVGSGKLAVRIGADGEPTPYQQGERGEISVDFDVDEPTCIYIYASDMTVSNSVKGYRMEGVRRANDRGEEDPGVMIYKLKVEEYIPTYNIEISGTMVNGQNASDFTYYGLKSGSISFDPSTYTLTLDNVDMEEAKIVINGNAADEDVQHLTINLIGNNQMKTNECPFYVWRTEDKTHLDEYGMYPMVAYLDELKFTSTDGTGTLVTLMVDQENTIWDTNWDDDIDETEYVWEIAGLWSLDGVKALTIDHCQVISGIIDAETITVQNGAILATRYQIDSPVTCGEGISYRGFTEGLYVYGPNNFTITETVTIGQYGMATFCSAQPLDFTNVAGLKAYIVSGFNDDPDNYKLTLTRVYDVKAGEGLLLIGDAGDYEIPVLQSSAQTYKNMLVGCTEDKYIKPTSTATIIKDGVTTEFTYTNFVLSKHAGDTSLGFYRFTTNNPEGRLIESGKAYLELEGDFSTSSVKGFSIVFNDDEPTAITDVEDSRGKIDDAVIYDLSGRRLNKVQKGVNIINGKKVIVK